MLGWLGFPYHPLLQIYISLERRYYIQIYYNNLPSILQLFNGSYLYVYFPCTTVYCTTCHLLLLITELRKYFLVCVKISLDHKDAFTICVSVSAHASSVRGLIPRIRKKGDKFPHLPCKSILCRFHSHQPHFPYLISLILLSIALASLDTFASDSSALVRLSSFAFICSSTSLILRSMNLRNIGSFSASFFISSKDSF